MGIIYATMVIGVLNASLINPEHLEFGYCANNYYPFITGVYRTVTRDDFSVLLTAPIYKNKFYNIIVF